MDQTISRRVWRWLMPSVSQWLWLVLLLVLLAQPWRTMMVASDGDACMHWRVGEWMLQNREVVRADVFSHTRPGESIISKEWLSEIIFAAGGRLGGLFGVSVVGALLIASTFALLHRQLLREGNELLAATVVTLLAVWAANMHWLARPHAFSFLLVLLWHNAVRRFERTADARRLAVSLGVLMLLWVNVHGAFLAGFMILSAYWVGAVVARDRRKIVVLAGVAIECAFVSLANPSGYKLHLHNLQFLRSDFLTGWLAEYSSTNFHSAGAWGFGAWLALIFLTLALLRPKIPAGEALMLISWTYFALYAGRNVPLLAILSAPVLCPALSAYARERWPERSARITEIDRNARSWPVVALIAAIGVVPRPTEMPAKNWPVEAVAFIKQHPEQFTGNMFNQYMWGGYLMEALPEQKTFVDGRTDFYGEDLIKEFADTTALRSNWVAVLSKYNVQWTLMPSDHRLNIALALSPQWNRVFSNETATIFRRNP